MKDCLLLWITTFLLLMFCTTCSNQKIYLKIIENRGEFTDDSGQSIYSLVYIPIQNTRTPDTRYILSADLFLPGLHYWFNTDGVLTDKDRSVYMGKWGLTRKTPFEDEFEILAEPLFDWHGEFFENRAAVLIDGKWGFIDTAGDMVIQPRFEDRGENYISIARLNPFTGAVTRTYGSLEWFYNFQNGQAWVCENGRCGIIDTDGDYILRPRYEMDIYHYHYDDSLTWFKENGKYGILDRGGNIRFKPFVDSVGEFKLFRDHKFWVKYNGKWALLDKAGQMLIKPIYDEVKPYDSHTWVNIGHQFNMKGRIPYEIEGRWGLVDTNGAVIIDPFVDSVEFGGSVLPEYQNGKWGYNIYGTFRRHPYTDIAPTHPKGDLLFNTLLPKGVSYVIGKEGEGLTATGRIISNEDETYIDDVQYLIERNSMMLNTCYQRELKKDTTIKGVLVLDITVSPEGRISGIKEINSTIDTKVSDCVKFKLRGLKFPISKITARFKLPLAFRR